MSLTTAVDILTNVTLRNSSSSCRIHRSHRAMTLCSREKAWLACWMGGGGGSIGSARGGFMLYFMTQSAVRSSENINIQEGKYAIFHRELDILMDLVHMVKEFLELLWHTSTDEGVIHIQELAAGLMHCSVKATTSKSYTKKLTITGDSVHF